MGKSSSSPKKKMTDVKFFILVLIVTVVIAAGIAFSIGTEEAALIGLSIAILVTVYLTLFRVLKSSNDPDHRLADWKYFFALSIFISGIVAAIVLAISQEEESIAFSILFGVGISSIISFGRWIKYRRKRKKAEKEREKQYQEQLERKNRLYADELEKKNRMIRELQSRNSDLQRQQQSRQASASSSVSSREWERIEEDRRERERQEQRQQEERKKERLEDWYRERVTINVSFDYHIRDSEYNQDYWERRYEKVRVSRREAMALIEAGKEAIMGKTNYHNMSLIRNISYEVPYGLYDRPMNC